MDCYIILEDEYTKQSNKSWARLIRKIYEMDPLICPRCGGDMRVIALLEDYNFIVFYRCINFIGTIPYNNIISGNFSTPAYFSGFSS